MKRLLPLLLLPLLAGCKTTEQAQHDQCITMGYRPGTALYLSCREYVSWDQHQRIGRATQGLAAGAAILNERPTVVCSTTRNPMGGTTICR
jgi:hypothetical protein